MKGKIRPITLTVRIISSFPVTLKGLGAKQDGRVIGMPSIFAGGYLSRIILILCNHPFSGLRKRAAPPRKYHSPLSSTGKRGRSRRRDGQGSCRALWPSATSAACYGDIGGIRRVPRWPRWDSRNKGLGRCCRACNQNGRTEWPRTQTPTQYDADLGHHWIT